MASSPNPAIDQNKEELCDCGCIDCDETECDCECIHCDRCN